MVTRLYVYKDRTRYFDFGEGMFKAAIIFDKDKHNNLKYYLRTPEGKVEVFAGGENRLIMEDGIFVLAKNRKSKNLSKHLET
jgi:hypothetical protein